MPAPQFVTTATLLGALLLASTPALGETFRLKLSDFQTQTAHGEDFLGVDFDFGHGFREISSVRLELLMPNGFGAAASTGNGSFSSGLVATVHDEATIVDFASLYRLSKSVFLQSAILRSYSRIIPKSSLTEIGLFATPPTLTNSISIHDDPVCFEFAPTLNGLASGNNKTTCIELVPVPDIIPEFALTGHGSVSLQGYFQSTSHPLGPNGPVYQGFSESRSITGVAGNVEEAWIVIEGTAVPEPSTAALAAGALLLTVGWIRRRG